MSAFMGNPQETYSMDHAICESTQARDVHEQLDEVNHKTSQVPVEVNSPCEPWAKPGEMKWSQPPPKKNSETTKL